MKALIDHDEYFAAKRAFTLGWGVEEIGRFSKRRNGTGPCENFENGLSGEENAQISST